MLTLVVCPNKWSDILLGRKTLSFILSMIVSIFKRSETYLKAFECEVLSLLGGVPVLEEAPESSPGRPREPPGPMRLPLLLREENIEVGPRVTFWLDVRLMEPLRRLKSSMPTWLLVC